MNENLGPLKGNYKQFIGSPGGIYFLRYLDTLREGLIYAAQNSTEPLEAMVMIKQAATIGEIKAHVDSLSK